MKYVAGLDIGSTTVRCRIYDEMGRIVGSAKETMILLYPRPRWVEMDPEDVWLKVQSVVTASIKDAQLESTSITCLGISCQRGSTLTWLKSTGKPLHNFICWQDMRADQLMQSSNESLLIKSIRFSGKVAYHLTGNKFMLAARTHKLFQGQPILFLIWALKNIEPLKKAVKSQDAAFGTLSTWILYKLSGGRYHIADASTLSTTGLFDTFAMKWSSTLLRIYDIPENILPTMVDAAGPLFVTTVFNASIPVTACLADVSASMFGSKCFNKGDLNIILGTGTFVTLNTADEIFISRSGAYPTVAWQIGKQVVYTMEGLCHNTTPVIKSALNFGLIENPETSSEMAASVPDTDGLVYIPGFSGLAAPINDLKTAVGMIGIKVTTNSRHMLRAMLESIAFRVRQILKMLKNDTELEFERTRISGGVSKNDLILKTIASLTGLKISRPADVETSAMGAAYLAGLHAGVWKTRENLPQNALPDAIFHPDVTEPALQSRFRNWELALPRFQDWYTNT